MIDFAKLPSYFWFTSCPQQPESTEDIIYTTAALKQDLARVTSTWDSFQASRNRNAIYLYLTAVFNLVSWWKVDNHAHSRAHRALKLAHLRNFFVDHDEPFAIIIKCTSDSAQVDRKMRSKWSRALQYALKIKSPRETLEQFMQDEGGVNACANKFTAGFRRQDRTRGLKAGFSPVSG
jgi:hypothetical protein